MNQDPRDSSQSMTDEPKPVAYDSEGRPLYAAPPTTNAASPKSVYFSRAVSPAKQQISDDVKARHDDSVKRFPSLNLSEAEYVISAVERHPIGLVGPVVVTVLLVAVIASFLINFSVIVNGLGILSPPPFSAILLVGILLILLVLVGGYIAIWIYTSNHFFLTN
jgi:hypothetical protein